MSDALKNSVARLLAKPKPVPARDRTRRVENRREQVLVIVRELGTVRARDLVERLDITMGNAAVVLYDMYLRKQLVRTGERKHFRYKLP